MDLGIDGRRALVIGASKGIGNAIATELAAEGARVALTSRDPERAAAAAGAIGAVGLALDTNDLDGVPGLVDTAEEALGGAVEILVCNTGGPPARASGLDHPRDEWETAYRTLVQAPLAFVTRCVPAMREAGWGRILNVGSTSIREPIVGLMLSNAHRAATHAAWKTLSRELAPDGITVNSVLPGLIATERLEELFGSLDAAEAQARETIPAGRTGRPAEMGALAAFLCSDRAAYITGQAISVDGGREHGA